MLTKESLEKSLLEKVAEQRAKQEQLSELAADVNALQGAILTLRWCIGQYEEQDAKA